MSNFKETKVTKKGYLLLGKVLAGVTQLEYTKMAIGDGQVVGDDYSLVTELVNVKLESAITSAVVNGDGSATIGGEFSNVGLTEIIEINEVGIYAIDPDEGEILYCYASAEGETNFIGPSFTTVLFENIAIQTDISSVENIIVNVIKPVDARNVSLDVEGVNADNVAMGIKEVSDRTSMLEKTGDKRNLLINSNFSSKFLVNQRGKTEYMNAHGYTIDRWVVAQNLDTEVKLVLEKECVRLESLGLNLYSYTDLRQFIENTESIKGKKVTLTFDIEASKGCDFIFVASGLWAPMVGDGIRKTISKTFTFADEADVIAVRLRRSTDNRVGDYVKIYSAKLEIGEVATPFVDDDPCTKLAKCQRYLYSFGGNITGVVTSSNTIECPIDQLTALRVAPTLLTNHIDFANSINSGYIVVNGATNIGAGNITALNLLYVSNLRSILRITLANVSLTPGQHVRMYGGLLLSAEI